MRYFKKNSSFPTAITIQCQVQSLKTRYGFIPKHQWNAKIYGLRILIFSLDTWACLHVAVNCRISTF